MCFKIWIQIVPFNFFGSRTNKHEGNILVETSKVKSRDTDVWFHVLKPKKSNNYHTWLRMISFSSVGSSGALMTSKKYPSTMRLSYKAGPSQTGHCQVGLRSFICRNNIASKHCRWSHVVGRQGIDILILPRGQATVTFKLVVAISSSSSLNFFLINSLVSSDARVPFFFNLSMRSSLLNFSTNQIPTTQPLLNSEAHLMFTTFGKMGESLHNDVMLIGLGGRFGSTFGLLVGIGFGSWHILLFTWTQILGGNSSPCSAVLSNGQNLSWTWYK